jgi:integrase
MGKKSIHLAAWRKEYLRLVDLRQLEDGTRSEKARCSEALCAGIGKKKLRKIRPLHIAKTIRAIWETGQQSRARRILVVARDMFAEAVGAGYLEKNPATFVKPLPYRIRRARLSMRHWRRTQAILAKETVAWRRLFAVLALITGQRRSDLAKMRFDDVWGDCLHVEQAKTGARIAIPLDLYLRPLRMTLRDVIEQCRQYAPPGETLLRKGNGAALTVYSLTKAFQSAFARAVKWDRSDRTVPCLAEIRSLAERLYSAQGVDTQTLLGHKHKATTAIYHDDRGLTKEEGRWRKLKVRRKT